MQQAKCPYCQTNIDERSPETFSACPHCGYRFAQVNSRDGGYLIIDSRLPDLMGKYSELSRRKDSPVVVIDRRTGQTPIAGTDRRR